MENLFKMSEYYRQYQAATIKVCRIKADLDKLKKKMETASSTEVQKLLKEIEEKQAEYNKARADQEEARYLSDYGHPKEEVVTPMKFSNMIDAFNPNQK